MSVRNILDETIKVGGGEIGPESQLEVASVNAQALSTQYINASIALVLPLSIHQRSQLESTQETRWRFVGSR